MYAAPWFQLLLLLIVINITICSVDRIPAAWKIAFPKNAGFNIDRFRKASEKKAFASKLPPNQLIDRFGPAASKGFEVTRTEESERGYVIFAEKYRWSRMGVYVVHLSIVLLLIGALIGSRSGFDGYVNIPEGDSIDSVRVYNSNAAIPLGFTVRCDDYIETYYDDGTPREFRSKMTILENGQPVLQKDIIMNDPLRYKGINIFQSSRGKMNPIDLALTFSIKETGQEFQEKVKVRQVFSLPEGMGTAEVLGHRDHFSFRGRNLGETFFARITPTEGDPFEIALPTRIPEFDERIRNGAYSVSVADVDFRYFTGLQVTRDPGVWVVYTGFLLIIIGCYVTFFMSHQRICVEVKREGNASRILVAGISNKNRLGMGRKIEQLAERLEALA